jgi:hypothetical protein
MFSKNFSASILRVEDPSAKIMAVADSSETLVIQTTRRHIPEDRYLDTYSHENQKPQRRMQVIQCDRKEGTGICT